MARKVRLMLAAACAALMLVAAGCGQASDTNASDGGSDAKKIVAFLPSGPPFLAVWTTAFEKQAKELGYIAKIYTNPYSQQQLDQQVQQVVASGDKPDAFVYWLVDPTGGASLAALSKTGVPVITPDQKPPADADDLYAFYVGNNDLVVADQAAEATLKARDMLRENGTLHGDGNALLMTFSAGISSNEVRAAEYKKKLEGTGMTILGTEAAGLDAPGGYKTMAALIPKYKDKGIDVVFAYNDAIATGVAQAFQEAGIEPGKDVMIVGGNCSGTDVSFQDKTQYSTTVLAAPIEGQMTMLAINRFFENGEKVVDGEVTADGDADAVPESQKSGPVSKVNFIPMPLVYNDEFQQFKLWGQSFADVCAYA